MIRRFLIVLLLFVLYEGFYFLPETLVVIPGVFRLSDSFFAILPLMLFICLFFHRSLSRYGQEIAIVLAICVLMLVSPLMAQHFFGQPYMKGLVLIRQNFFWLSFFAFVLLLRDIKGVGKAFDWLTVLVGIYVFILILTKYYPKLGLIHFVDKYYNNKGPLVRFGDFRLFFPYGTVPVYFFCVTFARLIHSRGKKTPLKKAFYLIFLLLVAYAVFSTYTRMFIASLLVVTAFALFTSGRRGLQFAAYAVGVILVLTILLVKSDFGANEGLSAYNAAGKTGDGSLSLQNEKGRMLQFSMYVTQFLRSPITGVGNIATRKDTYWENGTLTTYRKYGFFNGCDLGYPKIAGESGLAGLAWVVWFFLHFYRGSRETLTKAISVGNVPAAEYIARGNLYFFIYLLLSGFTLPHFVYPSGIVIVALSLAILAVTRVSVNELYAARATPDGRGGLAA